MDSRLITALVVVVAVPAILVGYILVIESAEAKSTHSELNNEQNDDIRNGR